MDLGSFYLHVDIAGRISVEQNVIDIGFNIPVYHMGEFFKIVALMIIS